MKPLILLVSLLATGCASTDGPGLMRRGETIVIEPRKSVIEKTNPLKSNSGAVVIRKAEANTYLTEAQ